MSRQAGFRRDGRLAATGAALYSAGQAAALVWVTKACPPEALGRYALALAWAAPALLLARMQLRYVLASCPSGEAPVAAFVAARAVAAVAAVAVLAAAAAFALPGPAAWSVFWVAAARGAEDGGDLLHGLLQRAGRWPAIARSQALHGLGGALALGLALTAGAELNVALAGTLGWQAAVTLGHDWPAARPWAVPFEAPSGRAVAAVFAGHASLGLAAALVSLNATAPRYVVERKLGMEAVGVYSALAQFALLGNFVVQAIGQAAIAPLGRAARESPAAFRRRTGRLVAFAAGAGLAGASVAWAAGGPLLGAVFRPAFAAYATELTWMMFAAGLTYLTAVLGYALIAAGERRAQTAVFALSAAAGGAAAWVWTPRWGLAGAVWAQVLCWTVAAAGTAVALAPRLRGCSRHGRSPTLSPCPRASAPDAAR